MNPLLFVIVFVHLSLTTAVNFTQVFKWPDGMDYVWPSEAKRRQALKNRTFKPENIYPLFMAVYGTRIFLSLYKYSDIPASLVSLPTSSASSASPKLTPFPSWEMHGKGGCNKIEEAKGLQVDSVGRLWVLDSGSENCSTKLWTIDLSNNHTVLGHRFSFRDYMHDLVLDETPNGTLAFISNSGSDRIVVLRTKPRYRLLKAAVGELSITPARPTTSTMSSKTEPTPVSLSISTTTKSSTPAEESAATEVQKSSTLIENSNENRIIIISLICSNVFIVVLSSSIILWLVLKLKRNNSLPQNTAEDQEMSVSSDNYDEFGPSEVQYEEVTQPRPFHLVPTISRFVSARDPSESNTCVAENVREIWRGAPFENYDVGPAQPEPWYDEVAPAPSRPPHYEDTSSGLMQYL
ncbi:uncharacterized protein LOC135937359 [Cloeon dipterum]|uniref:uncharacterized protein LOC135937359 n=1 Tax=Cloeon dipterum TaxID=197152 RepID=UPI00321F644C